MKDDEFQQPAHCKPCTTEQQRYCHSKDLLKDHCCCNQSHKKGKQATTPSTASLFMLEIYAVYDSIVILK